MKDHTHTLTDEDRILTDEDCDLAKNLEVETNITTRWEKGIPHHPESIKIYRLLEKLDWKFGNDFFCWKSGGDGDNGEHLMFELDIYFEFQEKKKEKDWKKTSEEKFYRNKGNYEW